MAINKATLAKEIDGVIEYIYPKTSGDIVVYDETHSVSAMIQKLINGKVDVEEGMGLSQNSFTNHYKEKLDGIDDNATKSIIDDALSSSSTNAIMNKIVTNKFVSYDKMLGPSADIKDIADGTVTGAILHINEKAEQSADMTEINETINNINNNINSLSSNINNKIGDVNKISGIGDGSISGAIQTISENMDSSNDKISNLGETITDAIVTLNNIKEPIHSLVPYTLEASKWSNGRYSLEDVYPSSEYTIYMDKGTNPTLLEVEALSAANIGSNLAANIFICNGTVPSIDIPVVLEVIKHTEKAGTDE